MLLSADEILSEKYLNELLLSRMMDFFKDRELAKSENQLEKISNAFFSAVARPLDMLFFLPRSLQESKSGKMTRRKKSIEILFLVYFKQKNFFSQGSN